MCLVWLLLFRNTFQMRIEPQFNEADLVYRIVGLRRFDEFRIEYFL